MSVSPLIRIGVAGVGALGSVHARVLSQLPDARFVGAYDPDEERCSRTVAQHGGESFADLNALLAASDALVIAAPTDCHHRLASEALDAGVHVLVEKPLTSTLAEGEDLVARAERAHRVLMVGHVERFNPVVTALLQRGITPRFLEAHRVGPWSFRSRDVGVVLDLMIHDLDLMAHLVDAPVESVDAVGVGILGSSEDLANARIVFRNGAVATATASRVARKTERRLRLFGRDHYASIDFVARQGHLLRLKPGARESALAAPPPPRGGNERAMEELFEMDPLAVETEHEPLALELSEFLDAIRQGREPAVTGAHGVRALRIAERVLHSIAGHLRQEGKQDSQAERKSAPESD